MRRFLFVLTVVSFPGWSQPAQQPAQPPIVVKVEMSPETFWATLLKLAVPTILGAGLGAGITLYGVRQTNKHNASENTANRDHQLRLEIAKAEIAANYKSQDNRWEFQKTVYVRLIKDTTDSIRFYANISGMNPDARVEKLDHFRTITDSFMTHMCHARLAMANEAFVALEKATKGPLTPPDPSLSDEALRKNIDAYSDLRNLLSIAGRNQLWGTPENEAKDEQGPEARGQS
jgi:hypothetical protein